MYTTEKQERSGRLTKLFKVSCTKGHAQQVISGEGGLPKGVTISSISDSRSVAKFNVKVIDVKEARRIIKTYFNKELVAEFDMNADVKKAIENQIKSKAYVDIGIEIEATESKSVDDLLAEYKHHSKAVISLEDSIDSYGISWEPDEGAPDWMFKDVNTLRKRRNKVEEELVKHIEYDTSSCEFGLSYPLLFRGSRSEYETDIVIAGVTGDFTPLERYQSTWDYMQSLSQTELESLGKEQKLSLKFPRKLILPSTLGIVGLFALFAPVTFLSSLPIIFIVTILFAMFWYLFKERI